MICCFPPWCPNPLLHVGKKKNPSLAPQECNLNANDQHIASFPAQCPAFQPQIAFLPPRSAPSGPPTLLGTPLSPAGEKLSCRMFPSLPFKERNSSGSQGVEGIPPRAPLSGLLPVPNYRLSLQEAPRLAVGQSRGGSSSLWEGSILGARLGAGKRVLVLVMARVRD